MNISDKSILFIMGSLRQGGSERVASELINYWATSSGVSVKLFLLTKQNKYYNIDNCIDVLEPKEDYLSLAKWRKFFYMLKSFFILFKTIKKKKYNIISFNERFNSYNIIVSLIAGQRITVSDRNNPYLKLPFLIHVLRYLTYPFAKSIICQTQAGFNWYTQNINNTEVYVINNPLKNLVIDSTIIKENIILNVGRLESQKNQLELITIFKELNNLEWKLLIIGKGTMMKELLSHAKNLGLSESNFEIIESSQNIDHTYQKSKIFAFTSKHEGFPNAICEAMGVGLPVISYDCQTGPGEIITHNNNGILVQPGNKFLFQQELERLVLDSSLRRKMGEHAIKINDRLNLKKISQEYLDVIIR